MFFFVKDRLLVFDGLCKPLSMSLLCPLQCPLRLQLPPHPLHGQPLPLPQLLRLHETLLWGATHMDMPYLCCLTPPHLHSLSLLLLKGLEIVWVRIDLMYVFAGWEEFWLVPRGISASQPTMLLPRLLRLPRHLALPRRLWRLLHLHVSPHHRWRCQVQEEGSTEGVLNSVSKFYKK